MTFFQQNIRDYEYDCVLALAMEALDYDDIVLINAPFTQEVRDNAFIADLKAKLAAKGVASVRARVGNLADFCPGLTIPRLRQALVEAFGQVYGRRPLPPWTVMVSPET